MQLITFSEGELQELINTVQLKPERAGLSVNMATIKVTVSAERETK